MKPQYQIIFWPALLFSVGIALTISFVDTQTEQLERNHKDQIDELFGKNQEMQRTQIRAFYFKNKDAELKNYYTLAKQSIDDLFKSGITDSEALNKAKVILGRLNYSQGEDYGKESDGYFFIFDREGTFHFHGRQPDLVGRNFLKAANEDDEGKKKRSIQIRKIIQYAIDKKKGFVNYEWEKPSSNGQGFFPKRAYVEMIEGSDLILGTGTYIDDLEIELTSFNKTSNENLRAVLAEFEKTAGQSIKETRFKIFSGAIVFIVLMSIVLWWSILRGNSVVGKKLAKLSRLIIKRQDDERNRIAKDLHDSVNPLLLANKMKIEVSAELLRQFMKDSESFKLNNILEKLKESDSISSEAMVEIRQVINDLKPLPLETLGLEGAIHSYISIFDSNHRFSIKLNTAGQSRKLPSSTEYTLLMVAKEAIKNAVQHASATLISVDLVFNSKFVLLNVTDNGEGMTAKPKDEDSGMGIQNMKERIEEIEYGVFNLVSSEKGTSITATVPYPAN